jgi:anti-sigma28 factor (negative regulator of flagellin synthesis)
MTKIATLATIRPTDHRKQRNRKKNTSPDGHVLMKQIMQSLRTTPRDEMLKRVISLPKNRRSKVLSIRRRIKDGTYQIDNRLDITVDRFLAQVMR